MEKTDQERKNFQYYVDPLILKGCFSKPSSFTFRIKILCLKKLNHFVKDSPF